MEGFHEDLGYLTDKMYTAAYSHFFISMARSVLPEHQRLIMDFRNRHLDTRLIIGMHVLDNTDSSGSDMKVRILFLVSVVKRMTSIVDEKGKRERPQGPAESRRLVSVLCVSRVAEWNFVCHKVDERFF